MGKYNFADMKRRWEQQDRRKHKALLKKYGNNAIGKIKLQLPEGKTLHEYLDELAD